jgi:hypothetical protein
MNKLASALATLVAVAFVVPDAQALNARSFVSAHGVDTNTCTLVAPCRTFAVAYAKTNPGGEIDVLDPAGYGSLTITHAISIVNDGVGTASILVPLGGVGITINAGTNDAVSLRGLTIDGAGLGQTGIAFHSGQSLTLENCVIRHVNSDGIDFFPNGDTNLLVQNTVVADNHEYGILVDPTGSGTVAAVFNRVELSNNGVIGLYVYGADSTGIVKAAVSDSIAANNSNTGFAALSNSGNAPTTLTVFHSVSAHNFAGLALGGSGSVVIRVGQSVVTGNGSGYVVTGNGSLQSYGDNYIDGNGPNTGSLTPISRQ